MTESTWADLLRQSGGKWFLHPRPWWWAGPVWIALSVMATTSQKGSPGVWSLLFWNTLGVVTAVSFLVLLRFTFFRNRLQQPATAWQMALAGAFAGATKYLVFTAGMTLTSHYLPNNDFWRFLNLSLVGALIVPGLSVVYTFRDHLLALRELHIRQKMREYLISTGAHGHNQDTEISNFIAKARQRVRAANNAKQLAAELEKVIDFDLRPLTKRLWDKADKSVTSFGTWQLLLVAIKNHQFSISTSLVLYVFSFSIVQISAVGLLEGVGRIAVQGVILIFIMWLANRLPQRSIGFGLIIFIFTNIAVAATMAIVTNGIFGQLPYLPSAPAIFVLSSFFLGVNLVLGIFRAAFAGQAGLINAIKQIDSRREHNQAHQSKSIFVQRELAQHLHSRVQNQMLNSAVRLNRQAVEGVDRYDAELELVYLILDDLSKYAVFSTQETLHESITRISKQWQGLVELRLNSNLSNDLPPSIVKCLSMLINEALTNAVRHGAADTVEIHLGFSSEHNESIELRCFANGAAPKITGSGLGFDLYDALAEGNWSLEAGDAGRGSVLRLSVKTSIAE